jgi:N-acetylmuramic acid 6-phosphate etherase
MIDVAVTNRKLHDRALRILADLTELSREDAGFLLERSGRKVKLALLMHWTGLDAAAGEQLLAQSQGDLRTALQHHSPENS